MDKKALAARQAPLKAAYREDPARAIVTMRANGRLGQGVSCNLETGRAMASAGLHPAAGGDGSQLCSGDLLLEALAACAGVTLAAVATSMGLAVRGGSVHAEGDLDIRGTLAVDKNVPVGFRSIRVSFDLDTDATDEELASLARRTERYCVVWQSLHRPPDGAMSVSRAAEVTRGLARGRSPG
jgi:uncharacterized OsmC-like protein